MSEAKRTIITQEVTETKQVPVPAVTLTLTIEEAEALHAVVGSISGNTKASPRKHTDGIYYALQRAGISTGGKRVQKQISGSLRWHNEPQSFSSPYSF
ncbi:hypothetical protein [Streptomyces sp. NPDC057854]|uniref:hypothetical protein n=1 Tax=unclassified Streptomyces TaxID=2593676 RepID=UPI0036B6E607